MAEKSSRKRRGRGEGGVRFDVARQLWVASVSLGYHSDGRRNRPVAYGKTKREALDALDELRRAGGTAPPEGSSLTVGQLLADWLAAQHGRVEAITHEGRVAASARIVAALGPVQVRSLTPLCVSRFYADMRREGVSRSAAWHAGRALAGCLSYAVKLQIVPSSPIDLAGLPPMKHREMVTLDAAQARALLAAAAGLVSHGLLAVALGSGCRQGELLGFGWPDADLDAGTLAVRRALSRTKAGGFVLKAPKTKAARRTLVLPGFAVDALRAHRAARRAAGMLALTVFCSDGGNHRHRSQLTEYLKRAVKRAGVAGASIPDGFRFHDLRHTHASLLLSQGQSLRAVSQRLGHTNPAFTLRVYAHCLPGDDARLADGLQRLIGDN